MSFPLLKLSAPNNHERSKFVIYQNLRTSVYFSMQHRVHVIHCTRKFRGETNGSGESGFPFLRPPSWLAAAARSLDSCVSPRNRAALAAAIYLARRPVDPYSRIDSLIGEITNERGTFVRGRRRSALYPEWLAGLARAWPRPLLLPRQAVSLS